MPRTVAVCVYHEGNFPEPGRVTLHELIRIGLMIGAMLLAVGGFGLVLLGLRGKRVGEHPHCAHCGYDLFGVAGHACPECGASVGDVSKIPPGRKRVRKRWVLIGGALLAGHGAIHWHCLGVSVPQRGLYSGMPEWLLVLGVRHGDGQAIGEVALRISRDELSNESLGRLAIFGIEHHQRNSDLLSNWDRMICEARARNLVSDDAWARFVEEATVTTLAARREVRQGDPLPLLITCSDPRKSFQEKKLLVAGECAVVEIDGRKVFDGTPEFGECTETGSWSGSIEADRLRGLGPGAHRIRMTVPIWKARYDPGPGEHGPWVGCRDVTVEADFTVLPADKPTVRAVRDPVRMKFPRDHINVGQQPGNELLVTMSSSSLSFAFLASIRAGGRIQIIRRIAGAAMMDQRHLLSGFVVPDATDEDKDEPIDLILTDDAEAAVRSVHVTDYWYGEMIVKVYR